MTQLDYQIKNRNKKKSVVTEKPIEFVTVAQFCKIERIKIQDLTLDDYINFWYYCKKNSYVSFGTESDDIEKSFTRLRKIIDRCQELLIF